MSVPRFHPVLAVFRAELLYNRRRVAPYVLFLLFAANAIFWQVSGPAKGWGWAINSDFFIARQFLGFTFLTLPFFTAMMMGEPATRDSRFEITSLLFSKPLTKSEYILGKFTGNYFVLVCCQAAFALAMFLGQAIPLDGVLVLPVQGWLYVKHFFFFVVVSHLALAAFCFTVGTLTRNSKLVYGLTTALYAAYIVWQLILSNFSRFWQVALDPLLLNWSGGNFRGRSAAFINQMAVHYNAGMVINRVLMIGLTAALISFLVWRFARHEDSDSPSSQHSTSLFGLGAPVEVLSLRGISSFASAVSLPASHAYRPSVPLPKVHCLTHTWRAHVEQFKAATSVEFRLLRAERSLVILLPLILFICVIESFLLPLADRPPTFTYAENAVKNLYFFLFGITVFYMGEIVHRDREINTEPLVWSAPVPNWVLIFSKLTAVLLLELGLVTVVVTIAFIAQIWRRHLPLEISTYFLIYALVLLPSLFFMASASVFLNHFLREKYLAYIVSLAIGGTLFYFYSQGNNHWFYNPLLYNLWSYADLIEPGGRRNLLLLYRVYWFAGTIVCLSLALLFYRRKSTREMIQGRTVSERGTALLLLASFIALAILAALLIRRPEIG